MKTNSIVQAKVSSEIKEGVEEILNDFGLDMSTAIRMFLAKIYQTRSIPFKIEYEEDYIPQRLADYLDKIADDIKNDKNIIHFKSNKDDKITVLFVELGSHSQSY